ncbi:MAG: hypothetical protein OEX81_00600 [Candidatus Pacebacteria bacterium]|nr:hypothetical protein [Candidatus Paceibacterota bacterium]
MGEKPRANPPETDDPAAWEEYLSGANLDMDRGIPGKEAGKQVEVYGDWVKTEEDEKKEDSDPHEYAHQGEGKHFDGDTCPRKLNDTGTDPLGYRIDQPGDDPVGDEVEERLDREYFNKD